MSPTLLPPGYFTTHQPQIAPLSLLHWINDGLMALLPCFGLAFRDVAHSDAVKLGILAGSIASALAGSTALRLARRAGRPAIGIR